MEAVFSLSECKAESLPHGVSGGIVRQFQVIYARHYGRQEVVRVLRGVHCLADYSQWRIERPEAYRESKIYRKSSNSFLYLFSLCVFVQVIGRAQIRSIIISIRGYQRYTGVYRDILEYNRVYWDIRVFTEVYPKLKS